MADVPIPDAPDDLLAATARQVNAQTGDVEFADPDAPTAAEVEEALAAWATNALEELVTAVDANRAAESAREQAIERARKRRNKGKGRGSS